MVRYDPLCASERNTRNGCAAGTSLTCSTCSSLEEKKGRRKMQQMQGLMARVTRPTHCIGRLQFGT
jgi:hypothetical protein